MDSETVERTLRAVEAIPSGQVISYGDLAGIIEITARQAGAVLARHGGGVPWWRVTNAAGQLPATLHVEAQRQWAAEGISVTPSGACRIDQHRADLVRLAQVVEQTPFGDDGDAGGC